MEMPKLMIQMETRDAPPKIISLRADGTATSVRNDMEALIEANRDGLSTHAGIPITCRCQDNRNSPMVQSPWATRALEL